jgi:hypothetical protein
MEKEKQIYIHLDKTKTSIDLVQFQKMVFLYNAIHDGWSIKKQNQSFIFQKQHEGKREIYEETFLDSFVKENSDMTTLLTKK